MPIDTKAAGSGSKVVVKTRHGDEFVAGLTAAFINTSFLFPVNKLIFRQMAGGYNVSFAADQMKEEGFRYLYRGILPPLMQKMVSISIMFGSFGYYKDWTETNFLRWHPIVHLAVASSLTGATEAVLTPLERVQMLLQDRKFHNKYRNTFDTLIKMKKFGLKEYYRGLTCVLLRNGPSNILFFGLRDEIKMILRDMAQRRNQSLQTKTPIQKSKYSDMVRNNITTTTATSQLLCENPQESKCSVRVQNSDSLMYDFLPGAILGMFISTLFYPLSVVRTRMQTQGPGNEFLSLRKAFDQVYTERDKKFSRFFHGCSINVFRQFLSWGIINCSYEMMLRFLHRY